MRNVVFALAGIVVALGAGVAFAGVPCAGTSTVEASPDCGAYCPASDFGTVTVTVTVKDCYGTPLEGVEVTVTEAAGGTGHCWCPGEDAKVCTTDASGVCTVTFSDFGGCDGSGCGLQFQADAEGVILGPSQPIVAANVDNTADCAVALADFINFASHYGTSNCCSDYNCDGTVALADFINFASHYGHSCP